MLFGIAVDFGCRGLENFRARTFGEAEHVDRAVHTGFGRLNRIELIMDRRRGTGQIVNLVDFYEQRHRNIMAEHLEIRMLQQMRDVRPPSGEIIVDAEHLMALLHKPVAQMASQKASRAGDQYSLRTIRRRHSPDP